MKAYIYFILGVCAAFLGLGIFAQPAEAAPLRAWGGNTYGEGAVPLVSDFVGIGRRLLAQRRTARRRRARGLGRQLVRPMQRSRGQ